MIWQQPWAWLGAVSIALPIVIHLLGRRRPRPIKFPTLRFIGVSKVAPARRHRLNDIPLLIVRIAILLAATAALAQPWLRTLERRAVSSGAARAIVVDTSASMTRAGDAGRPIVDAARDRARTIAGTDARARVIESPSVGAGLAAAANWLARQTPPRELVVVSDLQRGSVTDADLARVPADVGIHFERVNGPAGLEVTGGSAQWAAGVFAPHVTASRDGTTVTWQSGGGPDASFGLHAAPADRDVADTAVAAARTEGLPLGDRLSRIDLYLPGSPDRLDVATATTIDEPWMADVLAALASDPTLDSLARATRRVSSPLSTSSAATPVLLDGAGQPLLIAQSGSKDASGSRLQLAANVAADDVFVPAVIASLARASAGGTTGWNELEPGPVDEADLQRWTRGPAPSAAPTESSPTDSDGRWLWAVALILIGLETWMRRAPAAGRAEVERARVA